MLPPQLCLAEAIDPRLFGSKYVALFHLDSPNDGRQKLSRFKIKVGNGFQI